MRRSRVFMQRMQNSLKRKSFGATAQRFMFKFSNQSLEGVMAAQQLPQWSRRDLDLGSCFMGVAAATKFGSRGTHWSYSARDVH